MTWGLQAEDMFRLKLVGDPRLSAGGRYLAYVRGGLDRAADRTTRQVVVADLETGAEWQPGPAGGGTSRPRWSPDGRLAFACDAAGPRGTGQVWLWAPGDEAARRLAGGGGAAHDGPGQDGAGQDGAGGGRVTDLDWAPDGSRIAIARAWTVASGPAAGTTVTRGPLRVDGQPGLAAVRRRVEVLVVDDGAGEPWQVPDDAWFPRWSPDSARLAFLAGGRLRIAGGRDSEGRDAGGRDAAPRPGPGHGPVLAFAWAPSGEELAYLAPRDPGEADLDVRLFRGAVAGDAVPAELAAGWDRSLGSTVRSDDERGTGPPALTWSCATGRIYVTVADGGRGRIGWVDPDGGGYGYLTGGDRTCLEPSLDPGGSHVAFVSTSPAEPGDVHLAAVGPDGVDAGGERRVTDANPWLRDRPLAGTRPVTAGEYAGVPVEGWVTARGGPGQHPDHGRPLVVSVHGGPHYPAGWRFSFEAQRLAARGYAVLTANPPGSGGYGRRFATAIRGGWGTADWAGLEPLIDAAAAQPGVDAGRIAVTGVSYGGYLSQLALTRSTRFSAAISENGISNLLAAWGAEDDGGAWLTAQFGGPPWERPDAYVAASPVAAAGRIRTPLLLVHAELDRNCPVGQSEQMFAALSALGRTVELVVIDGEGHLMNLTGRPSRRLARARAVDTWLGRHLGQEGSRDDDS